MNSLFSFRKFLSYQWESKTKYYLHSPFVYQFYLNILEGEDDDNLRAIDKFRKGLASIPSNVESPRFGLGNKYGKVLYRLVQQFKPACILVIDNSIGINTSYMALANSGAKIISLEGDKGLVEVAQRNFSSLGIYNVEVVSGNFDDALPHVLTKVPTIELVFFRCNHKKESALKHFSLCLSHVNENSIFIFNDIYRNKEMFEAWEEIKQHPQITLTLDVFQFGICFFRKEKLAKENFVLRY